MKKLLAILLAAMLPATPVLAAELSLTPIAAPTEQPAGTEFACEYLCLTLPYGYAAMDAAALAGYEAAAESDYPGAAQTLLVASGTDGASLYIGRSQGAQDGAEAAREAALAILGNADAASERTYGANRFGHFACTAEDLIYEIFFLPAGDALLTIVACGMPGADLEAMLASLMPVMPVALP